MAAHDPARPHEGWGIREAAREGVRERAQRNIERFGIIPVGTDDPTLLALGASPLPCQHSPDRVLADPFLHGLGLDHRHPHQVQWCRDCGAGRIVYGNPHDGTSEITYGDWWVPDPHDGWGIREAARGAEALLDAGIDDAHLLAEHRAACDEIKRLRAEVERWREAYRQRIEELMRVMAERDEALARLGEHHRGSEAT